MKFFSIILSGFKMAAEEFRSNKLRTLLSLSGVAFGIFCIISVLTTIGSLEDAIQRDIKTLGSNTVYIDKWEYKGGPDFPWWKYINRPTPTFNEIELIRQKVPAVQHVAFETELNDNVEFENSVISNVRYYGVSQEFFDIQTVNLFMGRSLQQRDFDQSSSSILMGNTVATELFGKPENALDNQVKLKG